MASQKRERAVNGSAKFEPLWRPNGFGRSCIEFAEEVRRSARPAEVTKFYRKVLRFQECSRILKNSVICLNRPNRLTEQHLIKKGRENLFQKVSDANSRRPVEAVERRYLLDALSQGFSESLSASLTGSTRCASRRSIKNRLQSTG